MLGVTTQTFTIREVVENNWRIKKRFFAKDEDICYSHSTEKSMRFSRTMTT